MSQPTKIENLNQITLLVQKIVHLEYQQQVNKFVISEKCK